MPLAKQTSPTLPQAAAPEVETPPGLVDFGSNAAALELLGPAVSADELSLLGTTAALETAARATDNPWSAASVQMAAPLLELASGQLRASEHLGFVEPEAAKDLRRGALTLAIGPLLSIATAADVAPDASVRAILLHERVQGDLLL